MAKVLINDKMTRKATVQVDGYQPVVFYYRPALPKAVYEYQVLDRNANDGKEKMRSVVGLLDEHIQSWDIDSDADESTPAPVNAETIGRVPHPILKEMINYVTGYTVGEVHRDAKN